MQSYREKLIQEFEARRARNYRYSLRSFARDIRMQPSQLSEIFSGKKGLSRAIAERISGTLNLSEDEKRVFCAEVEAAHARNLRSKLAAQVEISKITMTQGYVPLSSDAFSSIADWYHSAIRELIRIPGLKHDSLSIARYLKISKGMVTRALKNLMSLNLIQKDGDRYVQDHSLVATPNGMSSEATRKNHHQFLEKSIEALYSQDLNQRGFITYTFVYDKEDVPAIKAEMIQFVQTLTRKYSQKSTINQLGFLSTQLVNLSDTQKETSK